MAEPASAETAETYPGSTVYSFSGLGGGEVAGAEGERGRRGESRAPRLDIRSPRLRKGGLGVRDIDEGGDAAPIGIARRVVRLLRRGEQRDSGFPPAEGHL